MTLGISCSHHVGGVWNENTSCHANIRVRLWSVSLGQAACNNRASAIIRSPALKEYVYAIGMILKHRVIEVINGLYFRTMGIRKKVMESISFKVTAWYDAQTSIFTDVSFI